MARWSRQWWTSIIRQTVVTVLNSAASRRTFTQEEVNKFLASDWKSASNHGGPSFISDITIRHPDNDNAVLLWHTDAPLSLRHPDSYVKVDLPWILRGLPTGLVHFKLKDGPLTVCRFAGDGDDGYRLGCGECHTGDGPYTQEFYTWYEVDD